VPTNEPCTGLRSCCDTLCTPDGFGSSYCYPMCGCRPYDDVCADDLECCSGSCGTPDSDGVRRCVRAGNCIPDGDVCGGNGASQNCCSGGKAVCIKTSDGVSRCVANAGGACYPTGHACSLCDECCSHVCVQQQTDAGLGGFTCAAQCIPLNGGTCTSDSDCCSGGVCQDGVCKPSGNMCVPLGGSCQNTSQCCQGACVGGFCIVQ
jgi:hypothetical protein